MLGFVPAVSKFLDLEMLLFLSGRERTEAEYGDLLERAGFELSTIVPTPSGFSVIEVVKIESSIPHRATSY